MNSGAFRESVCDVNAKPIALDRLQSWAMNLTIEFSNAQIAALKAKAAAESLTLMNSYPPMNPGRAPNHACAAVRIESRAPRAAARPRSADPPAVLVETMEVRFARSDEDLLARL